MIGGRVSRRRLGVRWVGVRWVAQTAALAVALALALVAAGCGFPTEDSSSPLPVNVPTTGESATTDVVMRTEEIDVWFVRDGLLVPLTRQVPAPPDAATVAGTVADGVSPAEADRGYRSAVPDPAMVGGAVSARGTATVSLSPAFADVPTGDQVLALGQLVLSLTELRGVGRVRFEIDGEAVAVPLPDGTSTDDVVTRDDFVALQGEA